MGCPVSDLGRWVGATFVCLVETILRNRRGVGLGGGWTRGECGEMRRCGDVSEVVEGWRGERWEFGEGVTTMECSLQSEDAATTCRHPGCSDMKTCGSEMGYNSYDQAKSKDTWLQ